MIVTRTISKLEGIIDAAVQMGTALNKEALKRTGLLDKDSEGASVDDLMISMKGTGEGVESALVQLDALLNQSSSGLQDSEYRPKTIDSALKAEPGLNFAIISVPGRFAKNEAMKALQKGMHVLLFSDNVSIEEEKELKTFAVSHGLLLMGPDCGTAIINNVPLGFANKVRQGNIGVVGAAGTGMQEVMTLIHKHGAGISQAIGTGGRDLSVTIGGAMMLQGLKALNSDKNTDIIVVISKPPAPEVSDKILQFIKDECRKTIVVNFVGGGRPESIEACGAISASTLEEAALRASELAGHANGAPRMAEEDLDRIARDEAKRLNAGQKYLRGLYSGGTLCYESMLIVRDFVGDVYSNTPLNKQMKLLDSAAPCKHTCLDLGDDEFTAGRAHPMLDTTLREQLFEHEASDPNVAVILLDIVIGYGSHSDPAGVFADLVRKHKENARREGRHLIVISSVCGTEEDPQNSLTQERKLQETGVIVMPSNAAAARLAGKIVSYANSEERRL
jgi:succinyl-CoA synthetase alpha subunit